jgi:hypothetical protein
VLTPPEDLTADLLASVLRAGWGLGVTALEYRPVGFGSHHWEVVDPAGGRWFVTADDLRTKRHTRTEPLDVAADRLRSALTAATALRDRGAYVVAPVPAHDGTPLVRVGDHHAVAVYPFITGRSFSWGDFSSPQHRRAVLDLVVAVHTAPESVRRHATIDDFTIPHRDELEAALRRTGTTGTGPYARPAAELVAAHTAPLRRTLDRYDALAAQGRHRPDRMVLTHGEPHPGNTMLTADGWRLIDWDTAMVAPPERDLWSLDPGDGSVVATYAELTGRQPLPAMLELFRIRWDLADIAVEVSRFRRPHTGSADDDQAWEVLRSQLVGLTGE